MMLVTDVGTEYVGDKFEALLKFLTVVVSNIYILAIVIYGTFACW